jgi:hypothetical protein
MGVVPLFPLVTHHHHQLRNNLLSTNTNDKFGIKSRQMRGRVASTPVAQIAYHNAKTPIDHRRNMTTTMMMRMMMVVKLILI